MKYCVVDRSLREILLLSIISTLGTCVHVYEYCDLVYVYLWIRCAFSLPFLFTMAIIGFI